MQVFGPRLGLVPDMGCTWFLPQLLGRARSRALALFGDRLPAEKAAEWGLIWAAVDDDKLMTEAQALAQRLAKGPALAFGEIKRVLDAAAFNSLDEQLELEREHTKAPRRHRRFSRGRHRVPVQARTAIQRQIGD